MALQAKLGAGAEVRHAEVVMGRQSKSERKVDVSVRGTLGTASVFVAIDCAHLDTNVDVMKVGIAKGQFEDIGAHRGIIVTTKGYSDGALELAAANGIDTCITRPATAAEAAARQESVRMTVRLGTFSVESCILHQLQNEAGEDGSLDENVSTALTTLPRPGLARP